MLPTEDFGCIYKRSSELTIHEPRLHKGEWTPQNLYITTDEEIRKGDWYIHPDATVPQNNFSFVYIDCRKIIATTDSLLSHVDVLDHHYLPWIPQSFIEEYCKAGGVDEVLVECEEYVKCTNCNLTEEDCECNVSYTQDLVGIDRVKLNQDNTIIIHPFKEKMYSRDEVIKIIQSFDGAKFASDHMEKEFDRDKWIEENL